MMPPVKFFFATFILILPHELRQLNLKKDYFFTLSYEFASCSIIAQVLHFKFLFFTILILRGKLAEIVLYFYKWILLKIRDQASSLEIVNRGVRFCIFII